MKKSHFRSDRVYEVDGQWYCMTREKTELGPFPSRDIVSEHLARYIASVSTATELAA